jgi:hypothetical protein
VRVPGLTYGEAKARSASAIQATWVPDSLPDEFKQFDGCKKPGGCKRFCETSDDCPLSGCMWCYSNKCKE